MPHCSASGVSIRPVVNPTRNGATPLSGTRNPIRGGRNPSPADAPVPPRMHPSPRGCTRLRGMAPVPGGRHSPGRPRVGTSSRGLGHQLGAGVTQYLVRPPDEVSAPSARCPGPRRGVVGCRRWRWRWRWWWRRSGAAIGGGRGCTDGQEVSVRNGPGSGRLSVAIGRGWDISCRSVRRPPGSGPVLRWVETNLQIRTKSFHLAAKPATRAPILGNPTESARRLTGPRGIRVAASFPGRDGGCQGSDPEGTPKAPLIPTASTWTITQRRPRHQADLRGTAQPGRPPGPRDTR